ncbi:hypothetical protein G7Y89_g12374 [Cudoniella acicularis]|uniref:Uncharacterized protein n=1 Tax=Cudoniella acicularis TaxID=354080 RepID=A0A8H4RA77_9HELO|nr:hypothetical protein G7Y89_g12374 [Cudoniella acicularis]
MDFGVLEVANSKAPAAPGWAYVPDTGVNASVTALQPRKRARNQTGTPHDTTAKQDAKILRELAALDRENHKDVSIPVPIRHRDNAGRISHGKVTPGVRKILQSQKTFANHLVDYEALSALKPAATAAASSQPSSIPSTPTVRAAPATAAAPHLTSKGTRSHKKKDPNAVVASTPLRRVSTVSHATNTPQAIKADPDIPMLDAPITLCQGSSPDPAPHPGDKDPLLISRIPGMPSQEEIEKLLAAPPLSYTETTGSWTAEDRRKPVRQFCEVCGYWGRVRCMRYGA